MWRNVVAGSRDLYLAHSSDGARFSAAQKLGEGTWKLDACPMDGGALGIDHGQVVSAWRRGSDIFLAQPGRPELLLGRGKDVAMAIGRKGPYVVWTSPSGLQLRAPGAADATHMSSTAGAAYPNLTSLPNGSVLAAWEEKGAIRVEKLP